MKLKSNEPSDRRRTHCVPTDRDRASRRTHLCRLNKWVASLFIAVLTTGATLSAGSFDDDPKSSTQQIKDWIEDLGSNDYATRQLATLHLGKRKNDAIPLAIQAVAEAKGEQADRLFQFISSIAVDPYSESGKLAFDALQELAASRTTSKSIRAEKILQVIGAEQRDLAVQLLEECRIPLRDQEIQVMSSNPFIRQPLVIDPRFSGNAEDLVCLKWLTGVQFARLRGPQIDRQILQNVISMPHLKKLQLVDTQLTAEDIAVLRDAPDLDLLEIVYCPIGDEAVETLTSLPVWGNVYLFGTKLSKSGNQMLKSKLDGVDLFVSRGGFLGVKALGNSTLIDDVTDGGAAKRDGLRRGDKMLSVNGVPIYLFDDLRKQLANYAEGETVTIEVERPPSRLDLQPGGFGPGGIPQLPQRFNRDELPKKEVIREKIHITLGKRDAI